MLARIENHKISHIKRKHKCKLSIPQAHFLVFLESFNFMPRTFLWAPGKINTSAIHRLIMELKNQKYTPWLRVKLPAAVSMCLSKAKSIIRFGSTGFGRSSLKSFFKSDFTQDSESTIRKEKRFSPVVQKKRAIKSSAFVAEQPSKKKNKSEREGQKETRKATRRHLRK